MSYRRNKRIRSIVETDPSIHLHPSTWRSFVYTARETIRFERETGKRGHRDLVIFILLSKDHATIRRLTSRWRQVAFIAIDGSSSWLIHRECCWVTTEGSMYETTTEKRFCNDSGRKKKKKKFNLFAENPRWILMKLIWETGPSFSRKSILLWYRDPTERELVKNSWN